MRSRSTGGIDSPRRIAAAMRSQRERTRPEVGRKLRSNSRARSTVPTISSSGTTWLRPALADEAERRDHLLVGQDLAHVVGLAAQPGRHPGHGGATPRAQEVVLRVDAGHSR